MTLFRMMVVLAGGLVLLLAVVIVRAETTRLHYEVARCERAADELQQQLVEAELELARLRNPTRIKQRMEQAIGHFADEPPPPEPPKKKRGGR
jgi:hypothetical protein